MTVIRSFMALVKADHLVQNLYELVSNKVKVNFNKNIVEWLHMTQGFATNKSDLIN